MTNKFPDKMPTIALALAATSAAAAVTAYALAVEPYNLELTRPVIVCKRLPAALDGLKILLIADTHTSKFGRGEEGLLDLLVSCDILPDIVVWAGDIWQKSPSPVSAVALTKGVQTLFPVPTYAVMGNAEHKLSKARRSEFIRELRNNSIRVLNNSSDTFTHNNESITVVGVDDPYYGHADVATAFANADTDRFTLFIAHSPQVHVLACRHNVDVMLSGHTHGGQVRLPFVGALRTQNPLAARMDAGLFDRTRMGRILGYDPGGDTQTYITRGVGVASLWHVPVYPRFLCRPEVALITLRCPSAFPESATNI